jgi:hypothetical protein
MVATDQEKPEGGKDSSSEPKKPEGEKPQRDVPLPALLEERSKRQAAEEANVKLAAELAKEREERKATEAARSSTPDLAKILKDHEVLMANAHRASVSRSLGINEKQADAVMEIMKISDKLSPVDALLLAKSRDSKLFESNEGSGYDGSQHSVLGAGKVQPEPPQNDWNTRKAKLQELQKTDKIAADELRNDMIGSQAAAVLGLPYKKIPI